MKKYNKEDFIEKAKEVHGNKYDYSKVEYINSQTKVCIICPEHGEFWQTPANHLFGADCPKCGVVKTHKKLKLTKEQFIEKAKEVHGNKYDYSKVEYINNKTPVCIICPEHGEFWQRPDKHIYISRGCQICGKTCKLTNEEFIEKAREIHGDKYDYSKVEYINNRTKVCIICPEHGEFWQTPHSHLKGSGCPVCNERKLEKEIRDFLLENNIKFEFQKKFKWLRRQSLDFFLPDYDIAIECQGIQHFEPVEYFGGKNGFKEQVKRDIKKKELCEKHNINLLYYTNKKKNYINNLLDLKSILNENRD